MEILRCQELFMNVIHKLINTTEIIIDEDDLIFLKSVNIPHPILIGE